MRNTVDSTSAVPRFDRAFFTGVEPFTRVGDGGCGGKASGLLFIRDVLARQFPPGSRAPLEVAIPTLTVITTDMFDEFMAENRVDPAELAEMPDDRIAHAFQRGSMPAELLGDLRALVEQVHQPLAVRSSSLLEDALYQPFAGVYATKMIPNNQVDADSRFRRLVEAVKFVYASTFFRNARDYRRATGEARPEKMAVIVQEIVGRRHGDRFYPDVSGVARSYSFYRSGRTRPEDGVVSLALGLGKTIVDGGVAWTYSPAFPHATAPFASARALLAGTQSTFWAVNMGRAPAYDPVNEIEYLVQATLRDAAEDGTLESVASTYDPQSDRLSIGLRPGGAWAVSFAPLLSLEEVPLNTLIRSLLAACEEALQAKIEIEFAVTLDRAGGRLAGRLGFLQVRPMAVSSQVVDVSIEELESDRALVASEQVMGNGLVPDIRDVVYVEPAGFDTRFTPAIAREMAALNRALVDEKRPYLLIGFGRWGSSDPWLGIPVEWPAINGASAIVEATLPEMNVDLSEGSHFFHNISSFHVSYFSVRHSGRYAIDYDWLAAQAVVARTPHVRHVRVERPLTVKVDGRSGRGVVLKN